MSNQLLDRIMPQATDLEQAIIGAMLQEKTAVIAVSDIIDQDVFYDERHGMIYGAIQSLYATSRPIDLLTVTSEMRKNGSLEAVGGAYYLTELTNRVSSAANVEYHARIVKQEYLKREMIRICTDYIKKSYDNGNDVFDLYENVSVELFQKVSANVGREASKFDEIMTERLKYYEKPPIDGLMGIGSGFTELDNVTMGWQKSNLIILAARPAMGKTALALNFASHAAIKHNKPVAIFSLEMSKEQLVDRMVSAETGIRLSDIQKRTMTDFDKISIVKSNSLINADIYIDDTASMNVNQFRSKATRLKQKFGIGFIVVDYLQLMQGEKSKSGNRVEEIGSISRMLKMVAKELDIPVMALSQLSRDVEKRPGHNKRPMLSDLRESGSIEQDADQVLFMFRPEYYGINEYEDGSSTHGITEILLSKNRNGKLDTAKISFNGARMKFKDIEEKGNYPQTLMQIEPQTQPFRVITLKPNENFDNEQEAPF